MTDTDFEHLIERAWRGQYRDLEEAQMAHRVAAQVGAHTGRLRWRADVVGRIATIRFGTAFEAAARGLPDLERALGQAGDPRWAAIARYGQALALGRSNRSEEALVAAQESLARVTAMQPVPRFESLVFLNGCGCWHKQLGHLDEALYDLMRASEDCKALGEVGMAASIESNIGTVYHCSGNMDDALESFERAAAMAEQGGATHLHALIAANIGQCLWRLGRADEALARSLPLLPQDGLRPYRSSQIWSVASLSASALGRTQALAWSDRAVERAGEEPFVEDLALARTARGHALLGAGRLHEAAQAFADAVTLVGPDGERMFRLLALEGVATSARALGDAATLAATLDVLMPLQDQLAGSATRARVAGLRIRNQLAELEAERDRARRAQCQAEAALEALRTTQQNLERANADLSQANARLSELHQSRTRMLAAACHDLRQPAHALGMLAEVAAAKMPADGRGAMDAIRSASAHLSEMLDALFDLTRLESDRYELSIAAVSLGDLFSDLRSQFAVAALGKGLRLSIEDVEARVLTDAHLLRRMLMNLLSNAIKYTARGAVEVKAQRSGSDWAVSVADTGPGIPADQQDAAFSEYVRLASSRGTDGLGIGLALVKRSAALLSHRLVLDSQVGQGSRFTVWLPAVEGVVLPATSACPGPGARHVIGLVDDDDQIRQGMRDLLSLRGYTTHAAATLESLHQRLREAGTPRPHLILSDLHLTTGQSLDALAGLVGAGGAWAGVPAVLITGDLQAELPARCQQLGIRIAYKPLAANKLTRLVAQLLAGDPGRPAGDVACGMSFGEPVQRPSA